MIFKILQVITLVQAIAASMSDTPPPKEPHFLLQKNLELIKNKLCVPWNDDQVNKKMIIKKY